VPTPSVVRLYRRPRPMLLHDTQRAA
jgi:hypothetical protein